MLTFTLDQIGSKVAWVSRDPAIPIRPIETEFLTRRDRSERVHACWD